jgi:hypothetical protein
MGISFPPYVRGLDVRLVSLFVRFTFYSHNRSGGVTSGMSATFDVCTNIQTCWITIYVG